MCKNPDDYDGKLVPPGYSQTCDNLVGAYSVSPAFRERDCDPKRGFNSKTGQECTGGDGCQLDYVGFSMRSTIKHCCKGGQHICYKKTDKPGARISLSLSLSVCLCVCVCKHVRACVRVYVCARIAPTRLQGYPYGCRQIGSDSLTDLPCLHHHKFGTAW